MMAAPARIQIKEPVIGAALVAIASEPRTWTPEQLVKATAVAGDWPAELVSDVLVTLVAGTWAATG